MIAPLAGSADRWQAGLRTAETGRGAAARAPAGRPSDDRTAGSADSTTAADGDSKAGSGKTGSRADAAKTGDANAQRGVDGRALNAAEQQVIRELQSRDREVRSHEAAHQAAGGALTGGASFSYQTGPDGKRYAVGGEVSVALSTSDDPRETIARMAQVRASALAPADPSAQDRSVAAAAAAISARAQAELTKLQNAQNTRGEQPAGSRFDATA